MTTKCAEETFGDFLARIAHDFGPLPALITKSTIRNRITTYAELQQQARSLAGCLARQGLQPGDRVLLWAPNSPEWVVCFFACQLVGAVVVPLDVRSSLDFVASVVQRTTPRLRILSRLTARAAGEVADGALLLEQIADDAAPTNGFEPAAVAPDDLAEIVFTSGTTGDPKGVMLTHRNLLSNVRGANAVFPCDPSFRLLSILPLSHVLEQTVGLLAPLAQGARIVYPVSRQPSRLLRTMQEHHITMIVAVPQALQLFMNAVEHEAQRQGRDALLHRLRAMASHLPRQGRRLLFRSVLARFGGQLDFLISGGAFLDPALAEKWELMGVRVRQGFGTTESSPIITSDTATTRKVDAVGRPLPGVEVAIAPDGEILARGANIFIGYWQNAAATASALADGWYHTGDLGTLDAAGYLHLKGRKKDLIVLSNGENVYPEDVEAALNRHPAVTEGVVLGLEGTSGEVEVHAVLLLRDAARAAEVIAETNTHLADHQRVRSYTVWQLDDFPRTNTLKVKKRDVLLVVRALQEGKSPEVTAPSVEATTPLAHLLHELEALPLGGLRPDLTLGGDLRLDSLGRVELLSGIENDLGAYIDEFEVTPDTTLGELEQLIARAQDRGAPAPFFTWPLTPLGRLGRELFLQLLVFPIYHLFWKIRVVGREHLRGAPQPLVVAANHHFRVGPYGADPAAAWMALPRRLRLRICTAGEEHSVFDGRVMGFLAHLVNAFPLSKSGNVRGSLEYMGRLLDLGWSILIFPEGILVDGGPLQPFMGGTGLLALEAGTRVVPLWIEVERRSIVQGNFGHWRGAFTVYIGPPLRLKDGASYVDATSQIEAAVRALQPGAPRN